MSKREQRRPTAVCVRCRHYFVTYVPAQPHGCRAYGFRSKILPSQVVMQSSGQPCSLFAPRQPA
jgi:hypothetical protein